MIPRVGLPRPVWSELAWPHASVDIAKALPATTLPTAQTSLVYPPSRSWQSVLVVESYEGARTDMWGGGKWMVFFEIIKQREYRCTPAPTNKANPCGGQPGP